MVLDGTLTLGELDRVHPLPQLVLRADPAAGAAVQHVPAGPGRRHQARELLATPPVGREKPRRRARCRRSRARSRSTDVSFGYDPASRCSTTSTSTSRPGETIALVGPTGAGKSTIAKLRHPLLRPDRRARCSIDGHDLRDVTLRLAAPPARRRARRSRSCSPAPSRDNIAVRPARRHRRRGRSRPCGAVGLADLIDAPARGARHAGPRARRLAVVGRAPAHRARPRLPRRARACWCSTRRRRTSTCKSETQGRAGARRGARGPHRDHRRPPPVHRDAGRPHRRRRRRPDRRARLARRAVAASGRYAEMYATWTSHMEPSAG